MKIKNRKEKTIDSTFSMKTIDLLFSKTLKSLNRIEYMYIPYELDWWNTSKLTEWANEEQLISCMSVAVAVRKKQICMWSRKLKLDGLGLYRRKIPFSFSIYTYLTIANTQIYTRRHRRVWISKTKRIPHSFTGYTHNPHVNEPYRMCCMRKT